MSKSDFWNIFEKNFWGARSTYIYSTYDASDASDEKHKFQRFWTWDFENGVKVTLGTTLDDLYKENSSQSSPIWQIMAGLAVLVSW